MAVLVWESPKGRVVYAVDRRAAVVGRDPQSDLVLDDASVSRRHALLEASGGGVKLTDLGSTAGTKINGADLTPHVPSTIVAGDFIAFGAVLLTFHSTPPPALPAAARATPRAGSAPPGSRRDLPWKWIALVALLLALSLGVAIPLLLARRGDAPERAAEQSPADAPGAADALARGPADEPARPPPAPEEAPPPAPAPPRPPATPTPAVVDGIPPAVDGPDLPDLLEIEGGGFRPARVRSLDADRIEATGSDGLLYRLPRAKVAAVFDREDLRRRLAAARAARPPGDAETALALARHAAARFLREEARALCREALAIRPMDPDAGALLRELGG